MIAFVSNNRNVQNTVVPVHFLNMSAFLTSHGIENDIVEIKELSHIKRESIDYYDELLIEKLRKGKYKYVGLSSYTTDYNCTISLIGKIKEALPDVKVILGGVHVTLMPRDPFMSNAPVDIVVIGEGEFPLLDILKNEKPLEEIESVCFLKNDKVVVNKYRPLAPDMSHIPVPAYDKIDMEFYLYPSNFGIRFMTVSSVHIFTGFGCPFNCTFCASASLYKAQGSHKIVRHKNMEQVFDEINFLRSNYGLEALYVQDDTFTLKKQRVYEFCDRLIKEKINMLWAAETRVNLIDEALVKKMKEAGCCQLDFGVESATQEALDRMKKGVTIEDTHKAFEICGKYGMRTGANIMLNTPDETVDDINILREFLKKLKASVYYLALTVPFLGTEIYEKYVNPKLKLEEYKLFENPYLYGTIIDRRFKLAKHNLPLESILMKLRMRFVMPKMLFSVPLKMYYLKHFIRSKYKYAIIKTIIKNIISFLCNGLGFLSHLIFKR